MASPPIKPGETFRFTVMGLPVGQGSMSAYPLTRNVGGQRIPVMKNGRAVVQMVDQKAKRLMPWRQDVAGTCVAAGWPGLNMAELDEAVHCTLTFYFPRPQSHYGTGKNAKQVKDSSPLYPETTGDDLDKLVRGVLDALTGIVWKDDKRVTRVVAKRRYGTPRVEIAIRRPRVQTVNELRALHEVEPEAAADVADDLQLDLFGALPGPTRDPAGLRSSEG